ncbi:MAG TPA: hypothetical protein PLB31_04335 [Fimbriimonadaceae bacterium]|nr:hypothetical protein [Fimbriimonadaceae bacterium]HRE92951.1 hypothetical protein [Fimbriimonadaceae bacterium]HRI73681.1 hypothetical protein [Fimbriimonadaceae bacterium]
MALHKRGLFGIAAAVILGMAGAGCMRPAPVVSIDVSRIPRDSAPADFSTPDLAAGQVAFSANLADQKPRRIIAGPEEARAQAALAQVEQSRQTALKRAADREIREVAARYEAIRRQQLAAIAEGFETTTAEARQQWWADQQGRIAAAGDWRSILAWRMGWPDPDPFSLRPPQRFGPFSSAKPGYPTQVRQSLSHESATIRAEWDARWAELQMQLEDERRQAMFDLVPLELEEMEAARQRAERTVGTDYLAITPITLTSDRQLPAVAGGTTSFSVGAQARQTQSVPWESSPWPTTPRTNEQEWIRHFAESRGYKVVPAAPGVKDVTTEYIAWRTRLISPSLNSPRP